MYLYRGVAFLGVGNEGLLEINEEVTVDRERFTMVAII